MNKKNPVTIAPFLEAIAAGQSPRELLGLSKADFAELSFEQLMENGDLADGVVKVETKVDTLFFGLFNALLVKHKEDGDVRYMFFGETREATSVIRIADLLFEKFGTGIYDEKRSIPFTRKDKIVSLSKGRYMTSRDELCQVWSTTKHVLTLQYAIKPMRQLALVVTEKSQAPLDTSVRTKGTVADLLRFDLAQLLATEEIDKEVFLEDRKLKYVDYFYNLTAPELGVFDVMRVRIFGPDRAFNHDIQTLINLRASGDVSPGDRVRVAEKLISIYSNDFIGSKELELREVESLHGDYWRGRDWFFNEMHELRDPQNPKGEPTYSVSIRHNEANNGFALSIMGYEKLISYFVAK